MNKKVLIGLCLTLLLLISCAQIESQDPQKVIENYQNEESLEGKIKIYKEFQASNPENEKLKSLTYSLSRKIERENGIEEAVDFIKEYEEYANPAAYNAIAWKIYESGENLELGADLSATGVEKARNILSNAKNTIPESASEEDWENSLKQSLAMILDTYASIVKQLGDNKAALAAFEEAVELLGGSYASVNENYISALISDNKFELAKLKLEEYIVSGNDTEKMKGQLKEVFVKLEDSGSDYPQYLAELKEKARENLVEQLKGEIKSIPANDFELLDLNGKNVKLSDFKGKTVILDFWATWCGPCLKSFPGMQKAIDKFSSDPKVKFLFVNTWERVEDKKQNALDFINDNGYSFHVLMDDQNEVVKKYSVRGIPTKFIIDGDQNIRFESIGFSGNEEKLIEELSIMISMSK